MATEITYIELDEVKAEDKRENGDYTIVLDNPITLNDGDQLGLFKSFIDTTVDGGENIKLENDIQLNLAFVLYTRNWWANTTQVTNMDKDGVFLGDPVAPVVDNKDYMVVNTETNSPADTVLMTEIKYDGIDDKGRKGGTKAFTGVYEYEDVSGTIQTTHQKIPASGSKPTLSGLKIRCRDGSFQDKTPTKTLTDAGVFNVVDGDKTQAVLANFVYSAAPLSMNFHLTPFIQKVNIIIPKGSYSPPTIAEFISTELTRIDQSVLDNVPIGSVFLTSSSELEMSNGLDGSNNQIGAFKLSQKVCIDSETGKQIYIPISGGRGGTTDAGSGLQYIIGASQIALTFQDNSIFTWEFLHTPYYVGASNTTKQIGIEYVKLATGTTDYGVVNKYGGIAFTSLTANILNENGSLGDAFDFWEDLLKFDVGNLCVTFEDVDTFKFDDSDGGEVEGTSTKLVVPFKDRVNTTGGLVSIDETIDKTSNTPFAYTVFQDELDIPTVISGTFGIEASQPYDVSTALEFPYFRLDIGCSVSNKIVGEKTLFKNTFGLIGRYYESGTFNTGTSADALVYQHKGKPVMLSSFNIRILDNEGNAPNKLGDRNTVFLQVLQGEK